MRRVLIALLGGLSLTIPGAPRATYVFEAFPNLASFNLPMGIVDPLDGTDRIFVLERSGSIHVFHNDPTVSTRTLFLDIDGDFTDLGEGGLLALAFHPDYENNGYFYVTYTAENPRREVLSRFSVDPANPDLADPASQLVILDIAKNSLFHNGGQIAFGSDGYLYWSVGEDGAPHLAQDLGVFNGKLLRIDVDNPSGGNQYGIPPDNPFVGVTGLDEIWAFGFRNPWRFSFDPPTGRLWLADVGENTWEEINIVTKGRNYGWPRMEGSDCFLPSTCDTAGLDIALPLFVYPHTGSASVTGGFVYRGPGNPSLVGQYIYADYVTSQIWALAWDGVNPPVNTFLTTAGNPPSFGVDRDGELFVVSFDGNVYRLFATATSVQEPAGAPALTVAPNPFQATTVISFSLARAGQSALEVFDVAGRRVATIADRASGEGASMVRWNGRDTEGNRLRSGVYFVRLSVDGEAVQTRRVTLIK